MARSLAIFICLLNFFNSIYCTGFYTISAPGTIRPNSEYHVAISTHNTDELSTVKLGIVSDTYSNLKTVDVKPNTIELVQFEIPAIKKEEYNLTAEGLSGIVFKNETRLNYIPKKFTVHFQTDKAIYKPGDLVRYRVLVLDAFTRPANIDGEVEIGISDAKSNKIRRIKDAKFTRSVFSDELQLSKYPVMGKWSIEMEIAGETFSKEFEVAEYVLPKFEVEIDATKHAVYKDEKIRAIIRAKYTFGKPIQGEATVSVYPKFYGSYQPFLHDLITRKVVPLDGKASIEFDMKKELNFKDDWERDIQIEAVVEEKLTGRKQNTSTTIKIHKNRYNIESVSIPSQFIADEPFTAIIKVVHIDKSPVQDTKNPVLISIIKDYEVCKRINETEFYMDKNGIVKFEWTLPESGRNYYSIHAQYLDVGNSLGYLTEKTDKTVDDISLEVLTEDPIINKEVSVQITTKNPMNYIIYQVIGRGDILASQYLTVPGTNTYVIKFLATFAMVPKAKFMVYFINENELIFKETTIKFEENFLNFIKLDVPMQASPGQDVEIAVSTKPNSFVGLLGVDQSVLLLKSGNDLSQSEIFSSLQGYQTSTPYQRGYGRYPGQESGSITLTNANYPYNTYIDWDRDIMRPQSAIGIRGPAYHSVQYESANRGPIRSPEIAIRKEFPETWIWYSTEISKADGRATIQKKVPDTITSWIVTGFSLDPVTGLGLTKTPRKLQVFQPFFVSTDLPYSVKRGEVIAIPVIVFNYMENDLTAEVTLDNTAEEFEFTEVSNEVQSSAKLELFRKKTLYVPSNTGKSTSFMIRPKKAGQITIKFSAITPISGDAVERVLLVEPEGVAEYINKAVLVDLREKSEFSEEVALDIPKNIVPDSTHIEVSVVGDILGPTIKNLDNLVRLPYGCGEQNMVNFVPNILVLKYLGETGLLTSEIETKAKQYLEVGYQRQLSYKHPDGSYSAFGLADKGGSTWLTAYVARSFRQAADYIQVDEKVIEAALKFLADNQAENGSFPEVGKVIDKQHSSQTDKLVGLTSFVLLAFLENAKNIPTYQNTINTGLDYIVKNVDSSDDIYSIALTAYVLQKADHSFKGRFIQILDGKATTDASRKWWSKPIPDSEKKNPWYNRPRSVNVEMTAYALLAYVEAGLVSDALPVLKWLVAQRNNKGGFESTQDTVVGLQALIKFAEKLSAKDNNIQIVFNYGDNTETRMNVNQDNGIVLQTYELPSTIDRVKVTGSGRGSALVQISYKYNVNVTGAWPRFTLDPQVNRISHSDYLHLSVCTSFVPVDGGSDESNMAVMEISMPSGFTVDLETIPSIEATERVKKVETKNGDTVVVVYFDSLERSEVCPTVNAYKTHKVANQKPAPVIIYDYYDNARQARQFYSAPKSSLCDICEGADCGNSCAARAEERQDLGMDGEGGLNISGAVMNIPSLLSLFCALILFKIFS